MKKLKAALFDLDGTLVDTLADIAEAMNGVLARHGIPPYPQDAYKTFVGDGALELARRCAANSPAACASAPEDILADYVAAYKAQDNRHARPYPRVAESLAALAAKGVPLGVCTNKPQAQAEALMALYFPGVFSVVAGQRPGVPLKPDPAGALAAATAWGVAPRDVAFVGDTGVDMRTAKNAGMFAVGALWGFRGEAELRENGADMLIHDASELPGLFG